MGFLNTATTINLTARLTPYGRLNLVNQGSDLIKTFSLGDSDANYLVTDPLDTGEIPGLGGNIGPNSTTTNGVADGISLRSTLILDNIGTTQKDIESNTITSVDNFIGQVILTGATLTHNKLDRNDYTTDNLTNLFYSFGLPLDSSDDLTYTGITFANNGYSNTVLSGLAQNNILVIGLGNTEYGELIDGKTVKIEITNTASTYTLYSTFEKGTATATVQDAKLVENSPNYTQIGNNIALLFSDDIKKPNGNTSLSWSTGYGLNKPFSLYNKQQFNFITNTNLGFTADTMVGIAYLDKGFIVITHPTIVDDFDVTTNSSATTVTLNSVSKNVEQNITCIANRGEFINTTNNTFNVGDTLRISEIGLYDSTNNLVAYGKTDRQLTKTLNQFLALNVKITL